MEQQTNPSWSFDEIVKDARSMIDQHRDPIGFQAAVFLLVSGFVGPHESSIYLYLRTLGVPRRRVREFARNVISNGIWEGGKVVSDWANPDPKAAQAAFLLDVLCAEGTHVRVPMKSLKGSYATVPKRSNL